MKTSIFILAFTLLISNTLLTACQSSVKKEETAQENVQKAQENLDQVQNDAALADKKKAAMAQDWRRFKDQTEAKLEENEIHLGELKRKVNKTGKSIDSIYSKKIDLLERKNKAYKSRIENYKSDKSNDWESFKREFNHDMKELGNAIKDITVDNKK